VRLAIDFDAFGGDQQRVNGASLAARLDLDLAQRTVAALKIRPELRTVVQVYLHAGPLLSLGGANENPLGRLPDVSVRF
jgi:hypothetical protein